MNWFINEWTNFWSAQSIFVFPTVAITILSSEILRRQGFKSLFSAAKNGDEDISRGMFLLQLLSTYYTLDRTDRTTETGFLKNRDYQWRAQSQSEREPEFIRQTHRQDIKISATTWSLEMLFLVWVAYTCVMSKYGQN